MKQFERPSNEKGGAPQGEVHNNERFNMLLNKCRHPRQICSILMSFVEPGVEQTDDMAEKRKVFIGDLLTRLDVAKGFEQGI